MKNLIISAIFFSLVGTLAMPSFASAQTIVDGDLISTSNSFDIYIVKIKGAKKFKRLILNPEIFNSYGHLKWENVKAVSQATQGEYTLSDLIIEINPDGSVADPKVYRVKSVLNSDVGERQWLNITDAEFTTAGFDWDSIYFVNHTEASPSFYPTKSPLTYQAILQEQSAPKPVTLSIASITPNQILNNIDSFLTIGGTDFKTDTKALIGSQLGVVTFISDTALSVKVVSGLTAGIYSVQVINSDGRTITQDNVLTILSPPTPSKTELSTQEITNLVSPAVVQIKNDKGTDCPCTGSGVIIDFSGHILTNEHVIRNDAVVEIKLNNGAIVSGIVLGWNQIKDLAIVKINSGSNYATLGNSDNISLGSKVVALGFPLTQFPGSLTVLDGSIANTSVVSGGVTYIQTTASIQRGSSGGPLVNDQGEVIGINTVCELFILGVCPTGWGQAIKINEANAILSDLKAGIKSPIIITPKPGPIVISNIQVKTSRVLFAVDNILDVTISWESNKKFGGGTVFLSTSPSLSGSQEEVGIFYNRVVFRSLKEDTTYYYRVIVDDTKSSILNFKTERIAPLTFEFNPRVRVGTSNDELGSVFISIAESFDKCVLGIKDLETGKFTVNPGYSWNPNVWWNQGRPASPGEEVRHGGYGAGKTYEYEFTCEKKGFEPNIKKGAFIAPFPKIYTTVTLNSAPNYPNLHGEFFFWHYGGSQIEGSLLNLKIQVTLNNSQLPNELIFYKSGVSNTWETLINISDGDILEINPFPSNYQLVWSFSGNPDDLSLKIIEGTATKNGVIIPFYF